MENEERWHSKPAILGAHYSLSQQLYYHDPYSAFYQRTVRSFDRAMEIQAFLQIVYRQDPDEERILEKLALELGHAY